MNAPANMLRPTMHPPLTKYTSVLNSALPTIDCISHHPPLSYAPALALMPFELDQKNFAFELFQKNCAFELLLRTALQLFLPQHCSGLRAATGGDHLLHSKLIFHSSSLSLQIQSTLIMSKIFTSIRCTSHPPLANFLCSFAFFSVYLSSLLQIDLLLHAVTSYCADLLRC